MPESTLITVTGAFITQDDKPVCAHCGWPITGEAVTANYDDARGERTFCSYCFHALHRECMDCGEWFLREEGKTDQFGNFLCDDCRDSSDWVVCNECGGFVREDDAVLTADTDDYYCRSCANDGLYHCEDCGDYYYHDHNGHSDDDIWICDNCYDNDWFTCARCDCLVRNGNEREYGDEYYCADCYDEVSSEEADDDGVHDYSFKPTPLFHKVDADSKAEHPLFFGIELEFSFNDWDDREAGLEAFSAAFGYDEENFYLKNDSSLERGFEMVSHPRTLESWHQLKSDMSEFLAEVGKFCIKGRDGLHVHISRRGMTPPHIVRFGSFVATEQDNVTIIARRNAERWACYHKKPVTGHDCKDCSRNDSRYTAVNWWNHSTVELRVFRATTDVTEFYAAIEFSHALYTFTKNSVVLKQILDGKAWPMFLAYITEAEERYPSLVSFWNERKPVALAA